MRSFQHWENRGFIGRISPMKQLRGRDVSKHFKKLPAREQDIILVLENIQYAKNVANIFRTAESAGVSKMFLTGISQRPPFGKGLVKVSRGAEEKVLYECFEKTLDILPKLKEEGYYVVAIEVTDSGILLPEIKSELANKTKICLIAGNEDSGVNRTTLELCDTSITIPMYGDNASLNVTVSVGVVLFSL